MPPYTPQPDDLLSRRTPDKNRDGVSPARVVVDLTPLLPGGENGGAKLLAMETVRGLSQRTPECQFLILTSERSHDELAPLDSSNVRRFCVHHRGAIGGPEVVPVQRKRKTRLRVLSLAKVVSLIPPSVQSAIPPSVRSFAKGYVYRNFVRRNLIPTFVKEFGAELLFCPLTMPFYQDPAIPTVSIVYDLQYLSYPQFFDEEDRWTRGRNFNEACRLSTRVVCISEFVRTTVLENSSLRPERVVSIPIRLAGRLPKLPAEKRQAALEPYALRENRFFLYPANFWAHKNHRMLLTAYGMYRARHSYSPFKLVCTGSPDARMRITKEAVSQMGLEPWVCLPGFLREEDFSALLASSYALVFPSLYEGFGMPVLEAMTVGKPVLCSNVTSLPEVAGQAAIYFDPRKPEELLAAMERVTTDADLSRELVARGREQSLPYVDSERMVSEYLAVFREALG
jgi:glycosyltransferase involved in cell wall biosynthesis